MQISGLGVTHADTECSVWEVAGVGAEMRAISLASRAKCQPSGLQRAHQQAGGRQAASPLALEAEARVHARGSSVPTVNRMEVSP